MSVLDRLRELISAEGEPLTAAVLGTGPVCAPEAPTPAAIAAAGPRARGESEEYELLIEAIYEGYLVHYGLARIISVVDPDLALLAGDRLYTLGLERLVALGDLDAVRELADVIALCSLLVGRGEHAGCDALWRAGARAVGWGADDAYIHAKALIRAGDSGAGEALASLDARSTVA